MLHRPNLRTTRRRPPTTISAMPARLSLVAALPKIKHLTEDEAARRLGVSLAELREANTFALIPFANPDPEFPRRLPTQAERDAAR